MNVRMHICISKIHISDLIYFKIEIADAKRSLGGKKKLTMRCVAN